MLARLDKEADAALAGATPYLRLFGLATGGCYLAQQALAALRLGGGDAAPRVALARFFAENFAVQAGALERTVVEGAAGVLGADAALSVWVERGDTAPFDRRQHDGFRQSSTQPAFRQ